MFLLYCLIISPSSSVCTLTRDIPNLQHSSYASNQFFCTLRIIMSKNSCAASVWTYWSCWIHVHSVSVASSPKSYLVRIFVVKTRFYKLCWSLNDEPKLDSARAHASFFKSLHARSKKIMHSRFIFCSIRKFKRKIWKFNEYFNWKFVLRKFSNEIFFNPKFTFESSTRTDHFLAKALPILF